MTRRVDPALTKRALSALKRAAEKAKSSQEGLTDWETEFLGSVEERLTRYGSAFHDPDKGQLSAPLSLRQGLKVRQISKKAERETARREAIVGEDEGEPAKKPTAKPRKALTSKKPLKASQGLSRRTGLARKGWRRPG